MEGRTNEPVPKNGTSWIDPTIGDANCRVQRRGAGANHREVASRRSNDSRHERQGRSLSATNHADLWSPRYENSHAPVMSRPSFSNPTMNTNRPNRTYPLHHFLEADSPNDTQRKRGRRPIFSAEFRNTIRLRYPSLRSERALLNRCYEERARQVIQRLGQVSQLTWLNLRSTILGELGRIVDEATLLGASDEICRRQPSSAEAVALIRRFRLGERNADPNVLADRIIATITRYGFRYPVTTAQMREALQIVQQAVESSGS